jgi:hypothetical protein
MDSKTQRIIETLSGSALYIFLGRARGRCCRAASIDLQIVAKGRLKIVSSFKKRYCTFTQTVLRSLYEDANSEAARSIVF